MRMKPEGRARAPGEHVMGLSRRRNDLHRVETIEVHLGPAHTPLVHERRVARCRGIKILGATLCGGHHDTRPTIMYATAQLASSTRNAHTLIGHALVSERVHFQEPAHRLFPASIGLPHRVSEIHPWTRRETGHHLTRIRPRASRV